MKDGSPRKSSDIVNRFQPTPERLEEARDRWDLMFSAWNNATGGIHAIVPNNLITQGPSGRPPSRVIAIVIFL